MGEGGESQTQTNRAIIAVFL